MGAFTVEHFEAYANLLVYDDGTKRGLEDWQLELAGDLFSGFKRNLWIIPEGTGKSTLVAMLALYGADYSTTPWIPIGAAASKQARIIHDQAGGFVQRTPGMSDRFRVYGGYLRIESKNNGGIGIEVFAHDPKTGDGVIPYPYALLDELHRHPDMRLWELWAGKLRKRDAQILGISTAGEPETPFENMRDAIRQRATKRERTGAHLRAEAPNEILHEWMVHSDEACSDMDEVKAANPLSTITVQTLRQDFELATNLGDWKRLKCNRPVRATESAITDKEWDDSQTDDVIPAGAEISLGVDVAWKWDTTAMVPLFQTPKYRLLGKATIITPPRDGTSIHPDEIKHALTEYASEFKLRTVVMDMHRAEDIAPWVEEELGVTVVDHEHRKVTTHVRDYEAFMALLRNGGLKHVEDLELRPHVLNAIARRLPGGDYRFDRPNPSRGSSREQDRRVIDGLTASAMVVEHSNNAKPRRSVYEDRFISGIERDFLKLQWPIRREKALTATPAVVEAISSRRTNLWPLLGGGSRQRINEVFKTAQSAELPWLYDRSPAVRTVVDLIVRNVGQLDLRLYEELSESEREPRPSHPAALSLRYPNPEDTRDHWVRSMTKDFLIFDNAYAIKFRNQVNDQTTLVRVPAAMVEVMGDELFVASGYRVHRSDGTYMDLTDPADMFHWRGEGPVDPRLGTSRLDTLRSVIAEDAALQQAIVELANSGLVSPQWVSRPLEAPEWSPEALERFEQDLHNRLRRSDKRPPVMEEGMELHDVGVSPRDAQMLEIRKHVVYQVASLYGVPLAMVGLDDNIDEARSMFVSEVLAPLSQEFASWLNKSVLVDEYGETEFCFEFNLDEKMMGDDRLKALVSASGRAVMTTDEARSKLNLPPIEGGDELVTPANVLVGENPKPSVDIMGPQNPNGASQDGDYREEPPKALETPQNGHKGLEVTSVPRAFGDLNRQERYVGEIEGVLAKFYERQDRVFKSMTVKQKGIDWKRLAKELGDDIHAAVKAITYREANLYVARLGGEEFDMRQVENYLKAAAYQVAAGIVQVTQEDVEEEGIDFALGRAKGERLEVAAASIGVRATRFSREEAAKQAPNPESRMKTWIPNTDRHANLGGDSVPLDQTWNGIQPGSEPNCQCSVSIS